MAVLAIGLIAGCTGGGDPVEATTSAAPTPPPTSTPEPTPTRTPMAFPTPAPEISEPTPEGAIAAGTQFMALYDYAFDTGDAGPLAAMSAEGCSYCIYVQEEVDALFADGYVRLVEPMRVVASDSTEIREDEWFRVHLRMEQDDVTLVAPDGTSETSAGGQVDFIFAISWVTDHWRVEEVDLIDVAE